MRILVPIYCLILLSACGGGDQSAPAASAPVASVEGYDLQAISGSSLQKATKKDDAGVVIEEGTMLNNQRSGTWTTYYPANSRVKSMSTYVNGLKNGKHIEMNDRGQVELEANYVDDVLDGPWTKYKFGSRKSKEVFYKMGVIDQFYREYHNTGKLMKDIQYKDGKMHGYFKQYDDKQKLLMEYQYENGQKVSGGIVQDGGAAE
ncbi:MAG: hypothetical protein AAFV25_09430 [Bacteroidota bacterium]